MHHSAIMKYLSLLYKTAVNKSENNEHKETLPILLFCCTQEITKNNYCIVSFFVVLLLKLNNKHLCIIIH